MFMKLLALVEQRMAQKHNVALWGTMFVSGKLFMLHKFKLLLIDRQAHFAGMYIFCCISFCFVHCCVVFLCCCFFTGESSGVADREPRLLVLIG